MLAATTGLPSCVAQAQTPPAPHALTLAATLQAARSNASVQVARAALEAARGDVTAADRSPIPVLSLKSASVDLQNGVGAGPLLARKRIDKGVGVDWTWERGDKRALRTRAAERSAAAAEADLEDTELQQLLAAATAWIDLAAAQERLQQVQAIEAGTTQLAVAAERRLRAGDLSQQDSLRADIEARRAQTETLAARQEVRRASLALATLIGAVSLAGRPADALQASAPWQAPIAAAHAVADTDLDAVLTQRPDVRAAQKRVDAARAALASAQALRKADITWGTSFDHFPGTSTRLLELRLQVPIQSPALGSYNYDGEIARAAAGVQQAEASLERLHLQARAELIGLQQARQSAALRVRQLEQDILPKARRVADSAELAYAKGALSLTDLLDARRTLRVTLLEAIAAHAEHTRADTAWTLRTRRDAVLQR